MNEILNFVSVIKACENANGAGTKKLIVAALKEANPSTKRLINEALNPFRVFGVRKFDRLPDSAYASNDDASPQVIFDVLDKLAAKELTGGAAQTAVAEMLAKFTLETAAYLERVIDTDLRAGFSAETFNKVHPNDRIATFEVMLADKCDTPEDFLQLVTFPCQGDWKYDGQRNIAIVRIGQAVEYRARSGKLSEHLNGLFDADLLKLREFVGYDFIMDGEAFASDFTETINAKKAGNDAAKEALRYRAFFMMPLTDWIAQKCEITMRQNRDFLSKTLAAIGSVKVIVSAGREVKNYEDMVAYCNEVIDVHKQEGLILKNWDALYQWERTMDWCKVKRFYDVDARITGWYKGRAKSRLENTCGGVSVEGRDEHGQPFRCNVGSGFSDELRADIAANFDTKYKHKTVVVTYQEISKSKGAEIFSLRFPTWNYLRDDKYVEALDV